jgi:hypothetical protein
MRNVESLIGSELEQMLPLPAGRRADWMDVVRRAGLDRTGHPPHHGLPALGQRRWRLVAVAAVVAAALIGVGVAIAASLGAFNGIGAAQHPPTEADKLDPAVAAQLAANDNGLGLELGSTRLVTQLADGVRIYAVPTKTAGLCVVAERLPNNNGKSDAAAMGCGSPLTQSQPSTAESFRANESTPGISWGIAIDGVTAVSFTAGSQEVTVPVNNNVWAYEGQAPDHGSITAHFEDGSTRTIG